LIFNDEEKKLLDDAIERKMAGRTLSEDQRIVWTRLISEFKISKARLLDVLEKDINNEFSKLQKTRSDLPKHLRVYFVTFRVFSRLLLRVTPFGGPNAAARNCELMLSLLLSKAEQDPAIGDFLERYAQKRKRLGRRRADLWAYSDVLRTIWPVVRRKLGKVVKFLVAADWVRRQFYQ
jgi:hypothetical protein